MNYVGQCPTCKRTVRLTAGRHRIRTHVTAKTRCAGMGEEPVPGTAVDRDAAILAPTSADEPRSPEVRHLVGVRAEGKPTGRPRWVGASVAVAALLAVGLVLLIVAPGGSGEDADAATVRTTAPAATPKETADPVAEASASASAEASRTSAAARSSALAAARSAAFAELRGLGQNLPWWNATYPAVPISECHAQDMWEYWETPGPDASGWRLPSGALACADPALPAWQGRLVGIQVSSPNQSTRPRPCPSPRPSCRPTAVRRGHWRGTTRTTRASPAGPACTLRSPVRASGSRSVRSMQPGPRRRRARSRCTAGTRPPKVPTPPTAPMRCTWRRWYRSDDQGHQSERHCQLLIGQRETGGIQPEASLA